MTRDNDNHSTESGSWVPKAALIGGGVIAVGVSCLYVATYGVPDWIGGTSSEQKIIPDNAPEECPGLGTEKAGKADACGGCPNRSICASGEATASTPDPALEEVKHALKDVKKVVLVLSGKGGVGKSTVSTHLAWALANQGHRVGLLDVDICGPSIPTMFGMQNAEVHPSAEGWEPVFISDKLSVMSIGFLLSNPDEAIVWRGPKKNGLIRQFFTNVLWRECDYLIIDTPPGTSDEHLSVVTYLKEVGVDGVVLVTTPQEVALADVRKEAKFCEKVGLPILGVVENMTDSVFDSFGEDGHHVTSWAERQGYQYLAKVPLNKDVRTACDRGIHVPGANDEHAGEGIFEELAATIHTKLENEL